MIEETLSVGTHISLFDSRYNKNTHLYVIFFVRILANSAVHITGYVIGGTVGYTFFFYFKLGPRAQIKYNQVPKIYLFAYIPNRFTTTFNCAGGRMIRFVYTVQLYSYIVSIRNAQLNLNQRAQSSKTQKLNKLDCRR